MGARDRPFPPGGLELTESRIFRMVCDLAYKTQFLAEKYSVEGQAGQTMIRKLGPFELRVEFECSRQEDLMRYTAMVFYEEHLVFNAWCSKIGATGAIIGLVVTNEDGPWRYQLRVRARAEEKT